jgi:hypothetical protein
MRNPQGDDKAETRGRHLAEAQLRPWPDWTISEQMRRKRVLALLNSRPHYFRGPGVAWWQLRQHLTGRVPGSRLRKTLDKLLDEGIIIECWYLAVHRHQTARRFLLVQESPLESRQYRLLKVRGRPDVLAELGILEAESDAHLDCNL